MVLLVSSVASVSPASSISRFKFCLLNLYFYSTLNGVELLHFATIYRMLPHVVESTQLSILFDWLRVSFAWLIIDSSPFFLCCLPNYSQ